MTTVPAIKRGLAPVPLTAETLARGLQYLRKRDADLAAILKRLGPPPMWERAPGFATLLHIILEQQVSLASAKAAYDRLLLVALPLTPERFLTLDDATLKRIGFSRQKTFYARCLAQAILAGDLDLNELESMDDVSARAELMKIKGIGLWTADIYLLMALRRPDVFPCGDRALVVAARSIKQLETFPTAEQLGAIAAPWRPWRAVAARLLWHYYLNRRVRSGLPQM